MSAETTRNAILEAAERLFSERGFGGVGLREIAREAGANVGSITYHFETKLGLLEAIYQRHTRPMNQRRLELLGEARRISDPEQRLMAVLRAYVRPAFLSSDNLAGGGARFTRMRAVLSAEGNPEARQIIAEMFDETSRAFIEAIGECLPGAAREDIVWRSQFLLGALYYALINPERITRLSDGLVDGNDHERAISEVVAASFATFRALATSSRAQTETHGSPNEDRQGSES